VSRARNTIRALVQSAWRRSEILLVERRYRLPVALGMDPSDHRTLPQDRNAYAPSPWRLLSRILPAHELGDEDVFVDFGCGKGRILLEAAELYPIRRVIGVEVEPHLADAARQLLRQNQARLRAVDWEVLTTDVLDYEIPKEMTVAYLYDPFTGPIFDALLSRVEASVERFPRRVRIVYLTPWEMARLRQSGRIVSVRAGTTGWLTAGGRWQYFVGDLLPR
jgi:SAM-dependent methyltransferase